jgi:hypothetical protein
MAVVQTELPPYWSASLRQAPCAEVFRITVGGEPRALRHDDPRGQVCCQLDGVPIE